MTAIPEGAMRAAREIHAKPAIGAYDDAGVRRSAAIIDRETGLSDLTARLAAAEAKLAACVASLEVMTELAAAYVEDYHRSMAGYRQARHDAMDADIANARAALSRAKG